MIVAIGYRGKQLGYATSEHGHIKARASSYVNATVELDAVEIISDVIPLIVDLAKGEIAFDTVTKIGGQLGLLFLEIPLEVILCFNTLYFATSLFESNSILFEVVLCFLIHC